jgi:histidine ammonia-lyase
MGSISALKLPRIVDNVTRIVAVELLAGAQAMEFFKPMRGGNGSQAAFDLVRRHVPFLNQDSVLSGHLLALESVVRGGELVDEVERVVGELLPDRGAKDS